MATFERKKNLFEKLAPLWAFLGMALHIGAIWFVFFKSDSGYSAVDNYTSYIRYIIWIAIVAAATVSFVPSDVTAIARHAMFWILASAVCIAGLYVYAVKYFEFNAANDSLRLFRGFAGLDTEGFISVMSRLDKETYTEFIIKKTVIYTLALCGAVTAFAAIKYKMSSSGWINKHIR